MAAKQKRRVSHYYDTHNAQCTKCSDGPRQRLCNQDSSQKRCEDGRELANRDLHMTHMFLII